MRGSSSGKKPTIGIVSTLASSRSEPYDWANACCFSLQALARICSLISSRNSLQRSTFPSCPNSPHMRTARSKATQAITFECVKWRSGPRTSQIPASGWRQPSSSHSRRCVRSDQPNGEFRCREPSSGRPRPSIRRRHRAGAGLDAALPMRTGLDSANPGSQGSSSSVSRRSPAMPYMIWTRRDHRRRRGSATRARLSPRSITGVKHRHQRQRGVPQPAIAIVPVAHAAQPFRQRGRRRGDDAARRLICQRLQDEQRLLDFIVVCLKAATAPDQAPQYDEVSLRACSGSIAFGGDSWEGNQVSTNGMRSPGFTTNSETVVISSP